MTYEVAGLLNVRATVVRQINSLRLVDRHTLT